MLGLIPLFFIGRWYYQLAHEFNKERWGYAFLGVGIAIAAQILFGFVTGFIAALTDNLQWLDNPLIISLIAFAFAITCVVIVYNMLKRSWKKTAEVEKSNPNLLDM